MKKIVRGRVLKKDFVDCMASVNTKYMLLAVIVAFSQSIFANESASLLAYQLEQLDQANTVTVVSYGRNVRTGELITSEFQRYEKRNMVVMQYMGCNYVTGSKKSISYLVDLLKKQRLQPANYNYLSHVQVAIYVTNANAEKKHIYIGRQHLGESTVDVEMWLSDDGLPYKAKVNNEVFRELNKWLRNYTEIKMSEYRAEIDSATEAYYKYCLANLDESFYRTSPNQVCDSPEDLWRMPNECPTGWKP